MGKYTRQSDTLPLDKCNTRILLVGAGSIGSYAAMALSKMGIEMITAVDFDDVEEENLNAQVYSPTHVGKSKVTALREAIVDQTGMDICYYSCRYDRRFVSNPFLKHSIENKEYEIVITAVDCLDARKMIFEDLAGSAHIIDPRMAIEEIAVHYTPKGITDTAKKQHLDNGFSRNEDAIQEPCTNKSIAYTALLAGGLVAKVVKDILVGGMSYKFLTWNLPQGFIHINKTPTVLPEGINDCE